MDDDVNLNYYVPTKSVMFVRVIFIGFSKTLISCGKSAEIKWFIILSSFLANRSVQSINNVGACLELYS